MTRFVTVLITAIFLSGTLSACSTISGIFGGSESAELVEDDSGRPPATKDQIKGLPDDLRGDTENARHTNQPLRGDDDAGGTEKRLSPETLINLLKNF